MSVVSFLDSCEFSHDSCQSRLLTAVAPAPITSSMNSALDIHQNVTRKGRRIHTDFHRTCMLANPCLRNIRSASWRCDQCPRSTRSDRLCGEVRADQTPEYVAVSTRDGNKATPADLKKFCRRLEMRVGGKSVIRPSNSVPT